MSKGTILSPILRYFINLLCGFPQNVDFVRNSHNSPKRQHNYRRSFGRFYIILVQESVRHKRSGAGFMRGICAGVSPNFGRKSEKAESFGFMRGKQKIMPDLLWRKDTHGVLVVNAWKKK